jgi:hypothetical protein
MSAPHRSANAHDPSGASNAGSGHPGIARSRGSVRVTSGRAADGAVRIRMQRIGDAMVRRRPRRHRLPLWKPRVRLPRCRLGEGEPFVAEVDDDFQASAEGSDVGGGHVQFGRAGFGVLDGSWLIGYSADHDPHRPGNRPGHAGSPGDATHLRNGVRHQMTTDGAYTSAGLTVRGQDFYAVDVFDPFRLEITWEQLDDGL